MEAPPVLDQTFAGQKSASVKDVDSVGGSAGNKQQSEKLTERFKRNQKEQKSQISAEKSLLAPS